MFQRQLSTTALGSSAGGRHQSAAGGPRLFQRQLTASQLLGPSSSTADEPASQQRVALSPSGRPGEQAHQLAGSATCLSGQLSAGGRPAARARLATAAAAAAASDSSQPANEGQAALEAQGQARKAAKNKRIISRMLSISAIHTSAGALGLSNDSNNQAAASHPPAGDQQQNSEGVATPTSNTCDQVPGETSVPFPFQPLRFRSASFHLSINDEPANFLPPPVRST